MIFKNTRDSVCLSDFITFLLKRSKSSSLFMTLMKHVIGNVFITFASFYVGLVGGKTEHVIYNFANI